MRKVITLIAGGILLSASHAVLAQIVFDSAVIDATNEEIVVKGVGLNNATAVFLGGDDVTADIDPTSADTELTLNFSTATANAVPKKGSYLLKAIDGGATEYNFSIYFDAPVIAPPDGMSLHKYVGYFWWS